MKLIKLCLFLRPHYNFSSTLADSHMQSLNIMNILLYARIYIFQMNANNAVSNNLELYTAFDLDCKLAVKFKFFFRCYLKMLNF